MNQKPKKEQPSTVLTHKSVKSRSCRVFSTGLTCVFVALLSLVMSGAGMLYGQSQGDAFFIDSQGRVGIGTTTPGAELEVAGNTKLSGNVIMQGGNVGIGTTNPDNKLTITAAQQAQEADITQNVANNGLNIEADYTPENRLPGIVWSTNNNNPAKPKAGIWVSEHAGGTRLYVGTSNNYATGITNKAITVKEDGNLGIGTDDPKKKLDVHGDVNIVGDIDVNHKKISNYKGFPTADFKVVRDNVGVGKEYRFSHNFGGLPSLLQVWVKSDGRTNSGGVYPDAGDWKMAGILSLWEHGASYGAIVEKIDSREIVIRTGNSGLFHGARGGNFFKTGSLFVKAWR